MAALFQCFRRKNKESSDEKGKEECKCIPVNKVIQCGHCNATLKGYWEREGDDGADGGGFSKGGINPICR